MGDEPGCSVSMMWLDPSNHMLGRVLRLTGAPLRPTTGLARSLAHLHSQIMNESARPPGHIALALSRPGVAEVGEDDHEWTKALRAAFGDLVETTWSLHLAAGDVDHTPGRSPHIRGSTRDASPLRSPTALLDRGWLVDHKPGVMPTQSLASVKAHFSHVIDEVAGTHERVTVTRNGSPVAVILAVEDYESLVETLEILSDPTATARRSDRPSCR